MSREQQDGLALEVSASSVEAIATAVLAMVDDDLHQLAAAYVDAELARRNGGEEAGGWLSVNELADLLGVHSRTIYRALTSGRLAGARVGSSWRVRREDLESWLTEASIRRPEVPPAPRGVPESFRGRVGRRGTGR